MVTQMADTVSVCVTATDPEHLVRAVGAGRRRGAHPAFARAELRPVRLKAGLRLQVTTSDGITASTKNSASPVAARTPTSRLRDTGSDSVKMAAAILRVEINIV